MGTKVLIQEKLTDTLTLSQCTDGYWLCDTQLGYNTAMSCKTEREAFISAINEYKRKLTNLKKADKVLREAAENFIESVAEELEIDHIL